jgi:hypothetical protein
VKAIHIPGETNTIADFLSRSFHLSDAAVLHHLNSATQQSWTLAHPPTELVSTMTSLLCSTGSPTVFPLRDPQPTNTPGTFGTPSVLPSIYTPYYKTSAIPSLPYNCLPTGIGREAWLPVGLKLALEPWRRPFAPWGRRSPHWGTGIHASPPQVPSTFDYNASYPAMRDRTQLHTVKSQSPFTSSFTQQPRPQGTHQTGAKPLQTCSCSLTTFSSVPESTHFPQTLTPPHSASDTYTSSTAPADCTGKLLHNATGTVSPKWLWNLTDKKMEFAGKWLASPHPDMSVGVPSKSSFAEFPPFDNKALPLTHPCTPIETQQTNGQQSPQKTLPHTYAPPPSPPTMLITPNPTNYQPDPSARRVPWPSCAQEWTQHSSNSLVGGDLLKCYATYTYNRFQ